jgi:hypothetical protein
MSRGARQAQCILVIIGATPEGKKELVGFADGVRESAESWRDLLLDLKRRGLSTAPQLAVADGALGFCLSRGNSGTQDRSGHRPPHQEPPLRKLSSRILQAHPRWPRRGVLPRSPPGAALTVAAAARRRHSLAIGARL